jgi:hypothetical protein
MRTLAVSGLVTGPDGPTASAAVRLMPSYVEELGSDQAFATSTTSTDAQGRFTLVGVPPGSYIVSASRSPVNAGGPLVVTANGTTIMMAPGSPSMPSAPGDDAILYAESPINVTDQDVGDIALAMQPGFRISGRVEFSGTAPRPPAARLAQSFVEVIRSDGRFIPRVPPASLSQNGTFATFQYPAGRYQVSLRLQASGWLVKSITANGRDVLGRDVDLSRDLGDVVMTLADRLPSISGVVRRTGSGADVKATVAIVPADYQEWEASGMGQIRARLVEAASSGAFVADNLLPGEYLVAAIDPSVPVNLQDPKDVSALAGVATRITVGDADQKGVSLPLSRIR